MLKLVIIADDLTGALDAAAPFSGISGGVVVATRLDALKDALRSGAGVVAVSTRSREIPAEEARSHVAAAMAMLPQAVRLFKKIDSRLKGNIGAELAPFGPRPLLVSPAIPDLGRSVLDGYLQGVGVADRIAVRSRLGVAGDAAKIPEVACQADLLEAVRKTDRGTVLVGARGLAQALAQHMGVRSVPVSMPLPVPFCIVVGSTDPITLQQVAALRSERPDLDQAAAPAGRLAQRDAPLTPLTLLQVVPGPDRPAEGVARDFAAGAKGWLTDARSMLLTGGATAEAQLDALQVDVLTVEGEILPGMPYCRAGKQIVITKSGGFGDADTLVRLADISEKQEA